MPEDSLQLVVGLGNPGARYEGTRHNVGADLVRRLAHELQAPLQPARNLPGLQARASCCRHPLQLLVPSTYMNLSGQAVHPLAQYYRMPLASILVVHDDLDLPPGCARLKRGGGHGGHNGLRDIMQRFGGKGDFLRLRLGIGHPGNAEQVTTHVLGRPSSEERRLLEAAMDEALATLPVLLEQGLQKAMTRLHSFKP